MDKLEPPKSLILTGNLAENWRFKQQFEIYQIASGLDKKDGKVQATALLHVVGIEALEVYNTFQWNTEGDNVKVDKIMEKFERYCNPRKNLTFERHSFFSRNQQEGDTIDAYVTELRNKAHRCEFSDLKDGLIRDRIVCGIMNDSVRARLLRESDLSLEKCVDICRAAEISTSQLRELNDEKAIHGVHVEEKAGQSDMAKNRREERRDNTNNNLCNFCGYRHRRGRCPAYGKTCNKCKKLHHFANVCKAREVNVIDNTAEEPDQHFFIGTLNSSETKQEDWKVNLKINEHPALFKMDTGAQCNVVSERFCKVAGVKYNNKTKAKLISYSRHELKAVGKATVAVECKDKYYLLDVHVVSSDVIPVLGLLTCSCIEMNLIQRVHNIESSTDTEENAEELLKEYEHLFDGIGTLAGEYKIEIEDHASATVHPPRRIPHMLKDKVKDELKPNYSTFVLRLLPNIKTRG